jgi:hypothetical protein
MLSIRSHPSALEDSLLPVRIPPPQLSLVSLEKGGISASLVRRRSFSPCPRWRQMFRSLTFVGARVDIVLLNDILLCCHRFSSLLPNNTRFTGEGRDFRVASLLVQGSAECFLFGRIHRRSKTRCCPFESLLPNPRYARVGEEGFEPPCDRTKTCCLTAWRLPNFSFFLSFLHYLSAESREGLGDERMPGLFLNRFDDDRYLYLRLKYGIKGLG